MMDCKRARSLEHSDKPFLSEGGSSGSIWAGLDAVFFFLGSIPSEKPRGANLDPDLRSG